MPNLTLALEDLRVDLAETQRQISILEQITRELTLIVDRCDGAGADPLIRRHLVEIDRRMRHWLGTHRSRVCWRRAEAELRGQQEPRARRREVRRPL